MFSAVYELLQGVVDYAGLFPPAKLPLEKVVSNYAEYLQCEEKWMLGRLIVSFDDLRALPTIVQQRAGNGTQARPAWRVSCLLSSAEPQQLRSDVQRLIDFNDQYRASARSPLVVDAVEVKASTRDELDAISAAVPARIQTFIELPIGDQNVDTAALIAHLAQSKARHLRAKVRTGGVHAELIPTLEDVAAFIECCARHGLPFKATAGLHHPVRGEQPLTYEQHAERAMLHGFLNVLLATAMLYDDPQAKHAPGVLADTEPRDFVPSHAGWLWRDQEVTLEKIKRMRQSGLVSFGSCSFIEPIEDLRALEIELTPE